MIFIKKDQKSIWIPRHYKPEPEDTQLELVLTHRMSQNEYKFTDLEDIGSKTNYWIFYNMDFTDLLSGEYKYRVRTKYGFEFGILQVMEDIKDPISYRKEQNKVIYNG